MKSFVCGVWLPLPVAVATALLCQAPATQAQAVPFELQPITVTGSGSPRTLGSEIAATSVLTRADIERSGARDLVSVLSMLGTALVEQQGGPGTAAVVRMRGADSRDTLVLVDGVPLTDVTSGQASISQIPAGIIERVEVVRGNLSALYGANATGGVIQVFTRRGTAGFAPQAAVGAGSRGSRSVNASVAGGSATLNGRLSAGHERTDGFSAIDPDTEPAANPDRDGNRRDHLMLALDAQPAAGQRLGFDLRRIDATVDYDSPFGAPTDIQWQRLVRTAAALRGSHDLRPGWTLRWHWADDEEERTDAARTALGASSGTNTLRTRALAATLDRSLSTGWTLQLGAERLRQWTDSASYTHRSRDTDTLRAGTVYQSAWGSVQANLRHDHTSDFGDATTGLLGGQLALGRGFSGIATVSNSFTPPTLDFLFYDCAPLGFVCSNPQLRPEKAGSVEAGLQWESAHTLVRVTAFAARYRDKIVNALLDPDDPNSDFVPQNLARARNNGVEMMLRRTLGAWQVVGEATLQDPVDADTGERLLRRARRQLSLRADYQGAGWQAGANLRHVGSRPDLGNTRLPSYTVLDASASWALTPEWSLRASVENLFDRRYQPVFGYNGRPRGVFVAVAWQPRR